MMKSHYSALELSELALPGLPATKRAILMKAKKENWKYQARDGHGGGFEFFLTALPKTAQEAIATTALGKSKKTTQAVALRSTDLNAWQQAVVSARLCVLNEIEAIAANAGRTVAIKTIVTLSKNGELRPDLQSLIETANAKSGKQSGKAKATLSRSTIYNWIGAYEDGGQITLAPKMPAEPDFNIPSWAPALLDLYRRPQKPSLAAALDELALMPRIELVPSYDQARRFMGKLSDVTKQKGRMGPQDLKSLKAFTRRDTSELWPGAVFTADGHTFKATVEHPLHGQPFRPEITTVIDVYTRYIVGWSIGLAEDSIGVLEALSFAMQARDDGRKRAMPAIWYTDNGPGFRAQIFESTATGFYDRWGITAKNSLPYNSQARGLIERSQQTWVAAAKKLDSYNARDMDKQATRQRNKITDLELKAGKKSPFDMTWDEFKEFIQSEVDAYNEKTHSALDRVRDPETKRRRHMSPLEKWQQWEDEGGEVLLIPKEDAADLFRPYERRKVARCEVQVLGNRYFSHDLEAHHGEEVMVGYDIHDAGTVWVRDFDNRFICTAELDGNAQAYFPVSTVSEAKSFLERKAEQRVKGRLSRVEEKRQEILAEQKTDFLEVDYQEISKFELEAGEKVLAQFQPLEQPAEVALPNGDRPRFGDDVAWAIWLAANPSEITEQDRHLLKQKLPQRNFQMLLEMNGVDFNTLNEATTVHQHRAAS